MMRTSQFLKARPAGFRRAATTAALGFVGVALGACGSLLEVQFPDRVPAEKVDDPTLAPVLVIGVIGDTECAYNNYFAGSAVQSDEFESATGNAILANYGERAITGDQDDYAVRSCEVFLVTPGGSDFGMWVPLHTARFQSEDIYNRLKGWTDAQVANRTSFMATVRAYGAYTYAVMGETFCSVAFDGGPEQPPSASLGIAEQRFTEAISLAQQAADTDIVNLARVGLARVELDLKKWSEAATAAALVPAGYLKLADRGTETDRRWNKLYYFATQLGAYVAADAYRTLATQDPRVLVEDAAAIIWINTKYRTLGDPTRLASYREAQLILAEAKAQQGDVPGAMAIINSRRAEIGLPGLTATSQAQAVTTIIEERRRELSFEGGHRLNDLLRYHTPWKVGTNSYTGRPYGSTTCWPFPTKERNGA